jgi:hypothetical protein
VSRTFPRIPELFAPLPLAAVALLALNDHVLKARFPGPVTGKLSDVAGCFVLPLFLSAALSFAVPGRARLRIAVGAIATVVLFASVKLWPAAAAFVAAALSLGAGRSRIVCDPTDLAALPLVALAVRYARRSAGEGA